MRSSSSKVFFGKGEIWDWLSRSHPSVFGVELEILHLANLGSNNCTLNGAPVHCSELCWQAGERCFRESFASDQNQIKRELQHEPWALWVQWKMVTAILLPTDTQQIQIKYKYKYKYKPVSERWSEQSCCRVWRHEHGSFGKQEMRTRSQNPEIINQK